MEVERAIDEIIKYDFMNIYKKVKKDDELANSQIIETPPDTTNG